MQEPDCLGSGQDAQGVGADGIEGNIAQVEQAGKPDHDVQTQAHQDKIPTLSRISLK